jgi:hypothetical protein
MPILERPMTDAELERAIEATLAQRTAVLEALHSGEGELAGMDYPLWKQAASAILSKPTARAAFPGLTMASFPEWLRAAATASLRRLTAPATLHSDPGIAAVARGMTEIALLADQSLTRLRPAYDEYCGRVGALHQRHNERYLRRETKTGYRGPHKYFAEYEAWLVAGAAKVLGRS